MSQQYIPPTRGLDAYHCPHCGTYAHQQRYGVNYGNNMQAPGFLIVQCARCGQLALWAKDGLVYPTLSTAPLPAEDMPEDVKQDYLEARNIVNASPRGAAALLRLALQKLMPHLNEKGQDINEDIKSLVKKGLSPDVQQALDAVRVIGNNAVHPGQLNLKDDIETATALFGLINLVVEHMITHPKKTAAIYTSLPQSSQDAIKRRDNVP